MQEQWIRWEPAMHFQGKYNVETLSDDLNGLVITLYLRDNKNHKIEVACKPYAEAYRQNSERFRLNALSSKLSQKYGNDFHNHWTLFKVFDSEYLTWLDGESGTISSYRGVQHVCLFAQNAIVDMAVRWEPEVRILKSSDSAPTK